MDVEQGAEHHDETNGRRKRAHSVQAEGSTAAAFRARMGSIGLGGQRRGSFSGGNRVTLAPIEGSKVTRKASWAPGEPRKASNASKAHALAQIMGAADFSPIMIICYSLSDGRLTYVNNEVFRILGPIIELDKPVESLLDPNFRKHRDPDAVRALFGIGLEGIEVKKSALELASAAGNALPAMLVMRVNPGDKTAATASLLPGHGFQADFLEWQTSSTYRATSGTLGRQRALSSLMPLARGPPGGGGAGAGGASVGAGRGAKPIAVELGTLVRHGPSPGANGATSGAPAEAGGAARSLSEWRELARWQDGVERAVVERPTGKGGGVVTELGSAHISSIRFHDFLLLRKLVTQSTLMLDLDIPRDCLEPGAAQSALEYVASAIVSDLLAAGSLPDEEAQAAAEVLTAKHRRAAALGPPLHNGEGADGAAAQPPSIVYQASSKLAGMLHLNKGGGAHRATHGSGVYAVADADAADGHHADTVEHAGENGTGGGASGGIRRAPPDSAGDGAILAQLQAEAEADAEVCDVLVCSVPFATRQTVSFVRFKSAVRLAPSGVKSSSALPPRRFVFAVLGPVEAERDNLSVGRAFSVLMGDLDFAARAQALQNKDELLEIIDGSIDQTNLTFAKNLDAIHHTGIDEEEDEGGVCGGLFCGLFGAKAGTVRDDPFAIAMDNALPAEMGGARKKRQAASVTVIEVPVSSQPAPTATIEVKTIEPPKHVLKLRRKDLLPSLAFFLITLFVALLFVFWAPRIGRHDVLHSRMRRYNAHIASPLYSVSAGHPLVLDLKDKHRRELVEVKLVAACTELGCGGHEEEAHRRRLTARRGLAELDDHSGLQVLEDASWVQWAIYAGSVKCGYERLELRGTQQAETLSTLDLMKSPCADAVKAGDKLGFIVTTDSKDGLALLAHPMQLAAIGRHRVALAAALFVLTFAGIISEVIHRCYATFIGSFLALGLVSLVHEMPELPQIISMIDSGTLMLLFAMMINVHILSLTGFFQWAAVRVTELAKGNVTALFFLLTNLTGFLSAFLDNVTCVLLIGPVTIKLCEQIGVDPVPFYLTETIAATIGGTATLIGDPPNVVIGNKIGIGFNDFLIFNGPLVLIIMPLATIVQYYRFRHHFKGVKVVLDMETLKSENKIHDEKALLFCAIMFCGIFLALFLSPIHGKEAAWFCLLGMLGAAVTISTHDIRRLLHHVEWDTILFFAALFVFVESLAELGLIRFVGRQLSSAIANVAIESRLSVALVLFIWVSALGSAFLESLPYTTTITYILGGMINDNNLGIPITPLVWALSVGACVGGIGSIMGSSANLVCLGVSERYSPANPVKGVHFLKYGFPLLVLSISIATGYQQIVFTQLQPYSYEEEAATPAE